jgi:predicted dinucleotide-binding enzyme
MKMSVKKTIAIVGATEKSGKIIAKRFSSMPYRLLLISNDQVELNNLSENISARKSMAEIDTIDCVKEGCWEADIIILAVPLCEENKVAQKMKEVSTQKIVVTVCDRNDSHEDLNRMLPYSKLVTVSGDLESSEISVNGEDETVNKEIMSLFNQAGFHSRENVKYVNN